MLSRAKHLGAPTSEALRGVYPEQSERAQGDKTGPSLSTTIKRCSSAQPPSHCGILPLCLRLKLLGRNSLHPNISPRRRI
jgi:hypothetical protein